MTVKDFEFDYVGNIFGGEFIVAYAAKNALIQDQAKIPT